MGVYAKAVLAILAAGLSAAVVALTGDNSFSPTEYINIAIAVVGAFGIFYVPNAPNAPVAKSVTAFLMAVLTLASTLIVGGIDLSEWLQIGLAGLAALGVYAVPNSSSPGIVK